MKIETACFVLSALSAEQFPRDGRRECAFVGRSNVGKSSLLNRLLGQRALARTSSTPGRTQAINFFLIENRFYFVDLPGYGYARAGKQQRRQWARLIETYFRTRAPAIHVVQLVDAKVGATELDVRAYRYLKELHAAITLVATKIDRVPAARRGSVADSVRAALGVAAEDEVIPFSARTGEGTRELWRRIRGQLAPEREPCRTDRGG